MRYFAVLLLLCAAVFVLPASAQKAPITKTQKIKIKKSRPKPAASTPTSTPATAEAGPVLTFERTPCFGTCPAYLMQVYADGRVAYEGRSHVPLAGKQELRLPAAAVADMLRQAKEAHFEQFDKHYSRGTTDLPSTIVAIRQPGGQLKTVAVEEGAPENVRDFFASLANQFDALAQIRADK